jgi:ArsR family transcriptional regulator, arsenate/arsenite/antimonite-responsive transcriptional repressor
MSQTMANTSPGNAGETADRLAVQLKALAHPARLEIIRQLRERECCCCGDFCATLDLAQSTVSQHLELLRNAGLVEYQPEGTRSRYRLNRQSFLALASAIGAVAAK